MKRYDSWNLYHWNPKNTLWRLGFGLVWMAVVALTLHACESFTEVDLPNSQLTADGVFEEPNTAHAAMTEIYAKMRDQGMLSGSTAGNALRLGLYADELDFYGAPSNGAVGYYTNSLLPSRSDLRDTWSAAYTQIYGANAVLESVTDAGQLPEADRRQLKGEALFVRALLHFSLTNLFGSVPYVTTTDYRANSRIEKITTEEVYANAKEDLLQAEELLGESYLSPSRTRPNKLAVRALLARLNLYAGNWAEASNDASAVLNSALYSYEVPEADMFLASSPATIWQFSSASAGGNTLEAQTFNFETGPPPLAALSDALLAAFEPGDGRLTHWTRTITDGSASWLHAFKYKEIADTGSPMERSQVLRLAEMYLIRAEARARQGEFIGAKEDLDAVRAKAGLPPCSAATQEGVLDAILQERRVELFAEGHRFFDLKRFGKLQEVLSAKPGWDAHDALFPLPEAEINLNPNLAPQNTGY